MRISRWPVLVCGWILAAVFGQTAFAVEPADESSEWASYDDAGLEQTGESYDDFGAGSAYQPVQYVEGGDGGMPGYGMNPYGAPGGDYAPTAWPNVSPYSQHNIEEHYHQRGLWHYDANDEPTKYIFSADMLLVWGLRPGYQLIGSGNQPANNALFTSNDNYLGGGTNPNGNNGNTNSVTNQDAVYNLRRSTVFANILHYGVRLRYGWENPDDSMFIVSGFYAGSNQATKILKAGESISEDNPAITNTAPLARIPYDNGGEGVLALFDSIITQTYDQTLWGVDADFYAAPFLTRSAFKMQMLWGVKYLRVNENWSLHALDSSTSGNYGPGETFNNQNIDPVDGPFPPPLDTWVTSTVNSNLIGPEIGCRYDLGGEKLKIWGASKIAVAANMEEMRVYGRNAYGNTDFLLLGYTEFDNRRTVTHLSPIVDQSIFGEFPLFANLPIFNRIAILNKANFRIGWNFIVVGGMQRPLNQVSWNWNNPTVRTNRQLFSISTVSFGIDWKY